jgi:hypothetical protein
MVVSREVSVDILKYLQEKKGLSVADIAKDMSTSPEFIQFVIEGTLPLTSDHINNYTKANDMRFWELAIEAIPEEHLTEKASKKIKICKQLSDHIKKCKKKF